MDRTKGVSLAKGPVGIIGVVLLAGGILGLLFGSTDFTTHAPNGDVTGETFLGIEGNGWTWLGFAAAGAILLVSAPLHWGAKTMALIVGVVMVAACVIAIIDGNDVFGVVAANRATMFVMGIAGIALLVLAMLPRVGGRRRDEVVDDDGVATTRRRRFSRRDRARTEEPVRNEEPVATTAPERRV
jgi:hypothetical protein